jgi:manganese-dependent inorganic pyrophosphatase
MNESQIHVVGHLNPDTDTIASAMGYAWLLRERDHADAAACRAGPTNPQTTWALKRLGLDAPHLLTDASPRFQTVTRRLDTTTPDSLLRDAWTITSRTGSASPVVCEDGAPYGMITGESLFNFMGRLLGPHLHHQDMRVAELLDLPCREACDTRVPRFRADARIRDALHRILRAEHNDFLVVDEADHYLGVCRQRDVLNPPRLKLILVDHNEPGQAVASLEDADLLEILDHHRLGNRSTHVPIKFTVDIVGSTSTLVSERIEEAGLSAPPALAGMLLAGLLSDTLILASPTTTERDRRAAERLARWAFHRTGPLTGETVESYGRQVLQAGSGLATRSPQEVVQTDTKTYEAGGYKFAISQAEVTDLLQLEEYRSALLEALQEFRERRGLHFAMLMVTDVVDNNSRLLLADPPPALNDLPYPRLPDATRHAPGIVSRKKQLLPVVLGLLER